MFLLWTPAICSVDSHLSFTLGFHVIINFQSWMQPLVGFSDYCLVLGKNGTACRWLIGGSVFALGVVGSLKEGTKDSYQDEESSEHSLQMSSTCSLLSQVFCHFWRQGGLELEEPHWDIEKKCPARWEELLQHTNFNG